MSSVRMHLIVSGTITALLLHAAPSGAQEAPPAARRPALVTAAGEPRLMGGITFGASQPVGDFKRYVGTGVGVGFHGLYRLDRAGAFALRLEAGALNYGRETLRFTLGTGPGSGRVPLDLTTTNDIFWLGVGPQLMAPAGIVRPYVNGTVGLTYFATRSSVKGRRATNEPFAETTNFDDTQFSLGGGGGVLIPVHRTARTMAFLDAGVRYHGNGRNVRYLREGGIRDLPDGGVAFDVIRSRADFVTWHLGVSVGGR